MKISHQSPSSDLSWTVQAPLKLETPAGECVQITAWSLSGLEWPDPKIEIPKTGILSVPFQGVDVRFPVRLSQQQDSSFVQFDGLSGRQRETLSLFYRSLLSGRMASSDDVITCLDTPVDLVPMSETEEEREESVKGRLPTPIRAVLHVTIYLLIAITIASILGASVFNSVTRINVQHGRVVAPIAEQLPASEGFVKSISVTPGERVLQGQILVRLKDPETQGKLDLTRARLAREQAVLSEISSTIRALLRLQDTDLSPRGVAEVGQAYARFIGDRGFDSLVERWEKDRETGEPQSTLAPFRFAMTRLREIEAAQFAKVRELRATRDAQKAAIQLSHVRAPADGIVHDVLVRKGQPYRRGDLAVTFESDAPRVAEGWVSERYAETIFIGMPATIGLNSAGEKHRLAGTVTNVRASADPRRPGEFGIVVTVTPADLSSEQTKTLLRIDAPVSLETRRPWAQRIITRVQSLWQRDV